MIRAYLYTALAAAVLTAGVIWHLSRVSAAEKAVHAHYAVVLSDIKDKTAKAERAFRAAEQAWQKSFEGIAKDGQEKLDSARRDAAGARDAADSLRAALNRYRATAKPAEDSGTPRTGASEQDSSALDLFSELLSGHTRELVEVGAYADALRAAGVTCERVVDALAFQK